MNYEWEEVAPGTATTTENTYILWVSDTPDGSTPSESVPIPGAPSDLSLEEEAQLYDFYVAYYMVRGKYVMSFRKGIVKTIGTKYEFTESGIS